MTEKLNKYVDMAKLLTLKYLEDHPGAQTRLNIEKSVLLEMRLLTKNSTSLPMLAFILAYKQLEQDGDIIVKRPGLPPTCSATDFNTTFTIAG